MVLGEGIVCLLRLLTVAIYLSSLIQTASGQVPLISAFYAVKWYHDLYSLESLTDSKLVCNGFLEAGKRLIKTYCKERTYYMYI